MCCGGGPRHRDDPGADLIGRRRRAVAATAWADERGGRHRTSAARPDGRRRRARPVRARPTAGRGAAPRPKRRRPSCGATAPTPELARPPGPSLRRPGLDPRRAALRSRAIRRALYRARSTRIGLPTSACSSTTPRTTSSRCVARASSVRRVVGLNHTRRDEHLARDIVAHRRPAPDHRAPAPGAARARRRSAGPAGWRPRLRAFRRRRRSALGPWVTSLERRRSASDRRARRRPGARLHRGLGVRADVLWALLFTSGTSAAPKAVRCTQRRLLTTGQRMTTMLEIGPDDVGYAAMPLFHANSLMAGLAPALVAGASLSLARRFSASRFLPDVRHYGATWFNYTGKLLAYLAGHARARRRRRQHRAGSPSGTKGRHTSSKQRRSASGSTSSTSSAPPRARSPSIARAARPAARSDACAQGIAVVDPDGDEVPRARFDARGPPGQRRRVRRRDRQHARGGTIRGVLPQRRSHAPHHAQRLVLERRPRVRRRRRLGLLRRAGRRTGCGWTERTSRPLRSRPSSPAIPTS